MNEDPYTTDWRGIGLPDKSPFDVLKNASRAIHKTAAEIAKSEANSRQAKAWRDKQAAKKAGVPNVEIKKADSTRTKMKKAAERVNKNNFHINTPAMDQANADKRRKIISTSKGGQ